jgi:hypothetical protein
MKRILAIARLTWKAGLRYRLFWVLAGVLLITVIGLPLVIKDDGTARGLTQILLTYTLGFVTTILSFATLWLACGTLARDVEECQMQVVTVKPIARWEVWIGKWLGILWINGVLLAGAGVIIFALVQWRASKLSEAEQKILRAEVLTARVGTREAPPNLDAEVEHQLRARLEKNPVKDVDLAEVRKQMRDQIKAFNEVIRPGYFRRWNINLGLAGQLAREKPLFLRVKFASSQYNTKPVAYQTFWEIGPAENPKRERIVKVLTTQTFHEIPINPGLLDAKGVLTIDCVNPEANRVALVFSLDEGLEVLYSEAGFALNFIRAHLIILLWLGFFAALGLAAASFMTFPVAAFASLAMLTIGLGSTMVTNVVKEGSYLGGVAGSFNPTILDKMMLGVFKVLMFLTNLVLDFSPIDALSTGRSVTWTMLGNATFQILIVVCGFLGGFGIFVFSRRELATAQGKN